MRCGATSLISEELPGFSFTSVGAADDYYKAKTINLVISGGAGDGYDIYTGLEARSPKPTLAARRSRPYKVRHSAGALLVGPLCFGGRE